MIYEVDSYDDDDDDNDVHQIESSEKCLIILYKFKRWVDFHEWIYIYTTNEVSNKMNEWINKWMKGCGNKENIQNIVLIDKN